MAASVRQFYHLHMQKISFLTLMVDQGPEVALFSSGYDPGIFLNCSQSTPVQFGSLQNTTTGGAAIFQHTSEEQKYQQH